MRESMEMIFIGQELRRHARFKWLTPPIRRTLGNANPRAEGMSRSQTHGGTTTTEEDVRFCLDFVIDTARRMQEFEDER